MATVNPPIKNGIEFRCHIVGRSKRNAVTVHAWSPDDAAKVFVAERLGEDGVYSVEVVDIMGRIYHVKAACVTTREVEVLHSTLLGHTKPPPPRRKK